MKLRYWNGVRILSMAAGLSVVGASRSFAQSESSNCCPASISVSAGMINFEGDEDTKDAFLYSVHLGYDVSDRWTIEGVLDVAPVINQNFRTDWQTGQRVSRLKEHTGVTDTSAVWFGVDGLYHFSGRGTVDPYLSIGAGLYRNVAAFEDEIDLRARAGAGVAVRLSDQWSVRADARVLSLSPSTTEVNLITTAGLCWSPGRKRPARSAALAPAAAAVVAAPVAKAIVAPALVTPSTNDVQMFELVMNFDEGQSKISPEYFSELDAIAKAIQSHPESKVRIEGHIDQLPKASDRDARRLTEKRADAVLDYFVQQSHIEKKRLAAVGYGFSRPKAVNDPVTGNPANRRIEIHILRPGVSE